MMSWLTKDLGLKALALALAVTLWLYVQGELARVERGGATMTMEREPLSALTVSVHPRVVGEPAPGYRVDPERITVEPAALVVLGRPQWLGHAPGLWTEAVDVSGARQTQVRRVRVGVEGSPVFVSGGDASVVVTVPVVAASR